MAYTTKELIAADFKNMEFTSTTNVSINDVEGFIADADAIIDSFVGARYDVPVTTESIGLNLLKSFARALVVPRVRAVMEVVQNTNKDANQNPRGTGLSVSEVMKSLREIKDGKMDLIGVDPSESTGGIVSYNVDNDIEKVFEKDEQQW